MTDSQEVLIKEALRSELGKTAKIWLYGRDHRTPMTFVLDEVERQIGSRFSVYWVDDGPPDVFTLRDPSYSRSPVIFSARYLSLAAVMRRLFVNDSLKNVLVQVAERTTLKLMAELALRRGDADYAVLAFVKSLLASGVSIADLDDSTNVMEFELKPIDESYMATWFYGLTHELGHLSPIQEEHFPDDHPLSDAAILHAITAALDGFSYPDSIKQEAIEKAKQQRSNSVLGIDQVRSEALADIFATSVLFQTTCDIMREINQKRFEVVQFMSEMAIFLNSVAIIDRCRRVSRIASATNANLEAGLESALHPISVTVRLLLMQRVYLESAVTRYLFDTDDPTQEQFQRVRKLINEINKHFQQRINLVDSGLARAMEFSFFPERRENDWTLLEAFRKEMLDDPGFALVEIDLFFKLADTLEVDSKLLRALKGLVDHPSKPLRPDPIGDLIYFVPWVEGPNGFSRPFGLDTKHGHIVFVFQDQDELYTIFFEESVEELKSGFTLIHTAIPVPRKERLGPELAAHMPEGKSFEVVVEGTEVFDQYMKELANGTIWDN